jgi:diadenosine tetraphosphate (Ap4A) HIT family hydrolase
MTRIYSTENFNVESVEHPHVSRTDGGHLRIRPKKSVRNRWDLNPALAIEFFRLTMVVGEAMLKGLNNRGIPVERINFQDNGNWAIGTKQKPTFHLHLYGRAKNAKNQKRGQALRFPDKETKFYLNLKPLNSKDNFEIIKFIKKIFKQDKYSNKNWHL